MRPTGCNRPPLPELTEIDWFAFMVFQKSLHNWDFEGDALNGMRRSGLNLERVRLRLEVMGFELSEHLLERLEVCENWVLERDAEQRARRQADQVN